MVAPAEFEPHPEQAGPECEAAGDLHVHRAWGQGDRAGDVSGDPVALPDAGGDGGGGGVRVAARRDDEAGGARWEAAAEAAGGLGGFGLGVDQQLRVCSSALEKSRILEIPSRRRTMSYGNKTDWNGT